VQLSRRRFAQIVELEPASIRISEMGPVACNTSPVELNPFWTRVQVLEDLQHQRHIMLVEGSRKVPVGEFLPPDERPALGAALNASVGRVRAASRRSANR
jgi:uncharacterized membrane protein